MQRRLVRLARAKVDIGVSGYGFSSFFLFCCVLRREKSRIIACEILKWRGFISGKNSVFSCPAVDYHSKLRCIRVKIALHMNSFLRIPSLK